MANYNRAEQAANYRHGYTVGGIIQPVYAVWSTMVRRCENPNNSKYYMYGARGIRVCDRWHDFKNFIADMGERPTPEHSLGRIDNMGHYEPGNCRWETRKEQGRNKRNNHLLEFNGKIAAMSEWSEVTGIRYDNLKNRINNLGWTIERALTQKEVGHGRKAN